MAKKFDFKKIGIRLGGITGGVALGKVSNRVLPDDMDPKIKAGLKAVVGAVVPELLPAKYNKPGSFVDYAAAGLIATGASEFLDEVAPGLSADQSGLNGVGMLEEQGYVSDLNYDLERVSGTDTDVIIHGTEEDQDDDVIIM